MTVLKFGGKFEKSKRRLPKNLPARALHGVGGHGGQLPLRMVAKSRKLLPLPRRLRLPTRNKSERGIPQDRCPPRRPHHQERGTKTTFKNLTPQIFPNTKYIFPPQSRSACRSGLPPQTSRGVRHHDLPNEPQPAKKKNRTNIRRRSPPITSSTSNRAKRSGFSPPTSFTSKATAKASPSKIALQVTRPSTHRKRPLSYVKQQKSTRPKGRGTHLSGLPTPR